MDYLALKQPQKAQLTRNPIVVIVDPVVLPANQSRVDLRYFIELKVQSSFQNSAFVSLPIQEASEKPIPANYTSSPGAYFEIQTRIDDQLKATPPKFGDTSISVCPDLVRQYYYVAERFNGETQVDSVESTAMWAYRGSVAMRHYSMYKDNFFTDVIGAGGRFLTWQPDGKFVREDQPERLYFLTNFTPAPSQIKVRVRALYEDGTYDTFTTMQADNITPMTVYCIPVGFNCMSLGKKEKKILSYTVWLANENTERISEERNFRLDRVAYESVRYIVFQNSLGGYDTIRCVGSPTESVSVSRQITERFTDYEYLPTVSDVIITNVAGQRQISVNVGNWINNEYREYLEEVLLSEEFYIVDDQDFIPVTPGFAEMITQSVTEWPIDRTLTFTYANPIGGFSRLPKIVPFARSTGWRQWSVSCELGANGVRTGKKIVNELVEYYLDSGENLRPIVTKQNIPGTPGYIAPWSSGDCAAGSTPFKNAAVSKTSTFKRSNCETGKVGGVWTMTIPKDSFGSEISQADADAKALTALAALDTQANADLKGTCVVASNVKIALVNKCADLGNGLYQPVPSIHLNGQEIISNTTEINVVRYADQAYAAGKYTFDVRIEFNSPPTANYIIRIASKNLVTSVLTGPQTVRFANLQIEFGEPDLIISVEPA